MARKKTVPAYCRHKATGQAVVRIDGRDHYLGTYSSPESRERYAALIAGMGGNWDVFVPVPPPRPPFSPLTVAILAARYDAHARTYYQKAGKPTAQYERVRRSMTLAVETYANLPAADFGPLALSGVREAMVRLGWSRKHVNSCVGCIKRAWRWAASMQLVGPAAYDALRTLDGLRAGRTAARETPPVGPVADDVVEQTLPHLQPETADMVRLQRLTAMRAGEVCILRAEEIDRSGEVWLWRPADHKTAHAGKGRVVLFGPRAQVILALHLAVVGAEGGYVFSPRRVVERLQAELRREKKLTGKSGSLSKRPPGERYTSNSYQRAIRKACDRAGVVPWHSNMLRHAAATAIRAAFGLEAAQHVLGHSRADVTQTYAERDLAKAVDAMRRAG